MKVKIPSFEIGVTLVKLEWVDSNFWHGWQGKEEAVTHKLAKCVSVGFLIKKTDEEIVICQSVSPEQFGDIIAIPVICISRLEEMKCQE